MWDTVLVVVVGIGIVALLGLAVLQRLEFRSVFRRRRPEAAPPDTSASNPRSG